MCVGESDLGDRNFDFHPSFGGGGNENPGQALPALATGASSSQAAADGIAEPPKDVVLVLAGWRGHLGHTAMTEGDPPTVWYDVEVAMEALEVVEVVETAGRFD